MAVWKDSWQVQQDKLKELQAENDQLRNHLEKYIQNGEVQYTVSHKIEQDETIQKLNNRIEELEKALKSGKPVYRKTTDTLAVMGVCLAGDILYYRFEPHIIHSALLTK